MNTWYLEYLKVNQKLFTLISNYPKLIILEKNLLYLHSFVFSTFLAKENIFGLTDYRIEIFEIRLTLKRYHIFQKSRWSYFLEYSTYRSCYWAIFCKIRLGAKEKIMARILVKWNWNFWRSQSISIASIILTEWCNNPCTTWIQQLESLE